MKPHLEIKTLRTSSLLSVCCSRGRALQGIDTSHYPLDPCRFFDWGCTITITTSPSKETFRQAGAQFAVAVGVLLHDQLGSRRSRRS